MRGINSQSKKHVHVAGGSSKEELLSVQGYFQDLGYEVSIVEGPLLLATASAGKKRVPGQLAHGHGRTSSLVQQYTRRKSEWSVDRLVVEVGGG